MGEAALDLRGHALEDGSGDRDGGIRNRSKIRIPAPKALERQELGRLASLILDMVLTSHGVTSADVARSWGTDESRVRRVRAGIDSFTVAQLLALDKSEALDVIEELRRRVEGDDDGTAGEDVELKTCMAALGQAAAAVAQADHAEADRAATALVTAGTRLRRAARKGKR